MKTSDPNLDHRQEWLEAICQQRELPSLSAAVSIAGEVAWKGACGRADLEPARPASPDMVYPLGSISKVFIVTMLMQLVEQGIVRLEDPLVKYLPEYRMTSPFADTPPTTLRQLAAHTSGLPRDAAINFPMNQSLAAWEFSVGQAPLRWYASTEQVLASLPQVALELPPDNAKQYSNLGIMLLGVALERACGQDFRSYMQEHIFAPLGLSSAGFVDEPGAWDARFPTGYGRAPGGGAHFPAPRWQLGGAVYTGGIYATAADLARFCSAFVPGETASPLLRPTSVQRMIHPAAMGDTHLGWWKGRHAGHDNFGHAGAHVGFISTALFIPELKLAVAVQANRWNPIVDTQDSTVVARELLATLIPTAQARLPVFDPAAVDLARYAGSYRLPGDVAGVEVTIQGQGLNFAVRGEISETLALFPVGPHQFGPPGTNFPAVTFLADAASGVTGLSYALFTFHRDRS